MLLNSVCLVCFVLDSIVDSTVSKPFFNVLGLLRWAGGPLTDRASMYSGLSGYGPKCTAAEFSDKTAGRGLRADWVGAFGLHPGCVVDSGKLARDIQRHPITVVAQKLVALQEDLASASPGRCSGVSSNLLSHQGSHWRQPSSARRQRAD